MSLDPLLLSRVQFAFVVSFHIIFPAFTIGLATWLATIEGMRLATGDPVYRRVFDFWLRVFALSLSEARRSGRLEAGLDQPDYRMRHIRLLQRGNLFGRTVSRSRMRERPRDDAAWWRPRSER
jgi:hypothetical protein